MDLLQQHISEILISVFIGFTFLQSGIDKVLDWKGNLSFIKNHFSASPLKNYVPLLLTVILILEIMAGGLLFIGVFHLALTGIKTYVFYGLILSAVTLIFLLVGQRLAKDYQGAMSLAIYFTVVIFGLHLLK